MYSSSDLDRFISAQEDLFPDALNEIKNGRKEGHWIWFVFPQVHGLGVSSLSQTYAIKSRFEAVAYLYHSVLGPRLKEISEALLQVEGRTAYEIMGSPDDMKLQSCMTLFALVSEGDSVFQEVLDKYFGGKLDERTILLLDT